ncbi:MAG: DUF1684 domain-containing protein [Calditrichaeota bacterium]|nr:DUF1684 domain-containing protein [Calditrichota bacterium]
MMTWQIPIFVGMALFLACAEKSDAPNPQERQQIIQQIREWRQQKDRFFKESENSPLLPEDRQKFQGLDYFPIDLAYRFEGPIIRYPSLEIDTIIATGGDVRPALRYGYFEFQFNGKRYRLQIYKFFSSDPEATRHLFLGFTDETNGRETYGGGRYIDLEENPENHYVVDFNLAYNPYCAYNPAYSCALPPAENHLPFPVRAGEKKFKDH